MSTCELYSFRKSKFDYEALEQELSVVAEALSDRGIVLKYKTDLALDARKIADAVQASLRSEAPDTFIFANALRSTDSSSFKKAFYELIDEAVANLTPDSEHRGMTMKIKVYSLGDLGNGYKGYCFMIDGRRFIALPCASAAGKDIAQLIADGLDAADAVFEKNAPLRPDGIAYFDAHGIEVLPDTALETAGARHAGKKRKKEGFFSSFIPHRGDTRGTKIRKIIVLLAILAFIGATVYVLEFFVFGPMRNNAVNAEIQEIAYRGDTSATDAEGNPVSAQDWDALKKLNKEIVGWITLPGTVIDYPVLEHKGDDASYQYYLKHTYKDDYSEYGSIFVDYRSKQSVNSKNLILHGHNMQDGSMFHELLNYSKELEGNLNYYKKHPVITFNTPEGDAKWKVISFFKTSTRYEQGEFFNYMQGTFTSDAEFMNFVYNMRIRSMFNIPVTVNEDDQILTLSTCSYEFYEWRTVLVARKVRPGEDETVDVQLASLNKSPLWPDVYYERYGGKRPDPLTFKKANAKGLITWYDGKGKLEGSEDLTATIAANPTEPPTEKPTKKKAGAATEPENTTFYNVTYRNYDGSEYISYSVREGDPVPEPDGTPGLPQDDEYYHYVFTGWDKDLPGVDFNSLNTSLELYPLFDAVRK